MKVFVSSTYIDLIEHRKAVERAINLLGEQFRGMEYFGARSEEPKVAALREVEQCDIFVGVYAHRYGTIPDGDTKSVTEQEFDHAQTHKKPTFCYRINAEHPWPPKYIEKGDAEKKLADFLKRVNKFTRQEFTSAEDLLAKVSPDLSRHMAEHGRVPLIAHPLPPVPYFVHTHPLQAHFTGRADERKLLTDWFARDPHAILSLVAIGGMGKSSLAWVWAQGVFSLGIPVEGVLWWSFYEERELSRFLEKAIAYASGGTLKAQDIPSDRERVDALTNLLRQKRFLVVLDGFERVLRNYARLDAAYRGDEVDEDARNDYRACTDPNTGVLLRSLASGAFLTKVLITTRLAPRELDDLEGAQRIELTGMAAQDAVAFFQAQGIKGIRAEIEAACADYGFHPLSLRLLSGTLVKDPRYDADIKHAPKVDVLGQDKERRILEFAYNSLSERGQVFISQLAAFRSPLKWEAMTAIFAKDFKDGDELVRTVTDLVERGLYQHASFANTFDMHPVVRRYCYDRLGDKSATHVRLREYFGKVETPGKIQSLADLQPVIELYHQTVLAERYDEAVALFHSKLDEATYYQFGAYQLRIELLRALFPDGEDKVPRLKDESAQAWVSNELANSYSASGQGRRAVPLYERTRTIREKTGPALHVAVALGNIAADQLQIGELMSAEQTQRRRIEISRENPDEFNDSVGRTELARLLAVCGRFVDAKQESDIALRIFTRHQATQSLCVWRARRAERALLMGDATAALSAARQALKLAGRVARMEFPFERDFVRAEWIVGAALVFSAALGPKKSEVSLTKAEHHLSEALRRDRRINLVEYEALILLDFARLRFAQAKLATASAEQQSQDALHFAIEALGIADRCEYRLQQADIHNFLSEWWLTKVESETVNNISLQKAREHAEQARERAFCDGPPHYYKVAYEKAERILRRLGEL
ncbi:MAG: DUF4062 domain-containing protein [Verrucomicrobiia bacterium]